MGKMAELAAEQEFHHNEPCEYCEVSRELAEKYAIERSFAIGSYAEKLKEAFEAGYKAGREAQK